MDELQFHSLNISLFLREDSDTEVSVLVGFEGGRDDQILSGRQTEAAADFSQVDEGFGASGRGMAQEEVLVQVDVPLTAVLTDGHETRDQTECVPAKETKS